MKKIMSVLMSVLLLSGLFAGVFTPSVKAETATVTYYVDPSSTG